MAAISDMSSMRLGAVNQGSVTARRNLSSLRMTRTQPLRAKVAGRVQPARNPMMVKASILELLDKSTKEDSRKYRRNVFGADEWKRHRSTSRYVRHISTMPSSSNIKGQAPVVAFFAGAASVYCVINEYAPPSLRFTLPMEPFTTTAAALSLLLVFRTNASYDRWWEARKIWGALLNRSRDFVRQGLTWFDEEDTELKEQLVRYTVAFAIALKCHLRPGDPDEDMRKNLEPILKPAELELAISKAHVPNHLLRMQSGIVNRAGLDPIYTTRMDDNITAFEDDLGKCERIFKTPIPMAYTRMTSRFLVLWLVLIPLALFKDSGWATIPAEMFISILLLGIEEVGVSIEEPFSIISCEGICGSVKDNCNAMLETHVTDQEVIKTSVGRPKLPVPSYP